MIGFLMAVDPGESTGYAQFNIETKMPTATIGVVKKENIWEWINKQNPALWVVEDYFIRPGMKRWDKGFAIQVIGAIKLQAYRMGNVPVILQQPSIKPVAGGITGYEYRKGKKGTHAEDAVLHGAYYLHKLAKA